MKKVKIALIIASCVISYVIGAKTGKKVVKETEIVEVEKVVVQENVRTIIKERPDGTKITTIEEIRQVERAKTTQNREKFTQSKEKSGNWSVWASGGVRLNRLDNPTYTLGVDRKILLGASVGLYGRTDGELGLTLRYSF